MMKRYNLVSAITSNFKWTETGMKNCNPASQVNVNQILPEAPIDIKVIRNAIHFNKLIH